MTNSTQNYTVTEQELTSIIQNAISQYVQTNKQALESDVETVAEKVSYKERFLEFGKDTLKDNAADVILESYKGLFIDKLSTLVTTLLAFTISQAFASVVYVFAALVILFVFLACCTVFKTVLATAKRLFYVTVRDFCLSVCASASSYSIR